MRKESKASKDLYDKLEKQVEILGAEAKFNMKGQAEPTKGMDKLMERVADMTKTLLSLSKSLKNAESQVNHSEMQIFKCTCCYDLMY